MATEKQKKAAEKMSENIRKEKPDPVGKVLQEAGYSESVSESPQRVTESKGFIELMDEMGLSDDALIKKNQQLLDAKRLNQMHFDPAIDDKEIEEIIKEAGCTLLKIALVEVEYTTKKGEVKTFEKKLCFYSSPDALAQQKALDTALKVKGKFVQKIDFGDKPIPILGVIANVSKNNSIKQNNKSQKKS